MKRKSIIIILSALLIVVVGCICYPPFLMLKEQYFGQKNVEMDKNDYNNNDNGSDYDSSDELDKKLEKVDELKDEDDEKEKDEEDKSNDSNKVNSSVPNNSAVNNNQNSGSSNVNTNTNTGGSSSGSQTQPTTPSAPSTPTTPTTPTVPSTPQYASVSVAPVEDGQVSVSQNGNSFVVTGSMKENSYVPAGLTTGYYVDLTVQAPTIYPDSVLANARLTLLYSNKTYTQAANGFLDNVSSSTYAYFTLRQEFMYGKQISIVVDWGDGNPITYTFLFNIVEQ